jgi:hypothetical protein
VFFSDGLWPPALPRALVMSIKEIEFQSMKLVSPSLCFRRSSRISWLPTRAMGADAASVCSEGCPCEGPTFRLEDTLKAAALSTASLVLVSRPQCFAGSQKLVRRFRLQRADRRPMASISSSCNGAPDRPGLGIPQVFALALDLTSLFFWIACSQPSRSRRKQRTIFKRPLS